MGSPGRAARRLLRPRGKTESHNLPKTKRGSKENRSNMGVVH